MSFRTAALVLPCAFALQASHPRGDYNIKGGATMTSFPEFNVQYDNAGAAASLHGTTESNRFVAALDQVLEKQAGVMEALEKTAHASLIQGSDRATQSPMVWLNLRHAAHANMMESQPMGESQATVNVFEAPRSMLLSPEGLSAPFEVMDFFVESGSGALPGAASLESISTKSDALLRQVKPSASLMESLPAFNVHVAQGAGAQAVQLSETQQSAILNQRTRLIQTLKERRARLNAIRANLN